MPTENARAGIFMTHHRAALAGRVAGCEAGRVAGFVLGPAAMPIGLKANSLVGSYDGSSVGFSDKICLASLKEDNIGCLAGAGSDWKPRLQESRSRVCTTIVDFELDISTCGSLDSVGGMSEAAEKRPLPL